MTLAAAALMVGSRPTAAQGARLPEAARHNATTDREKTNIEIALAQWYSELEDFTKLLEVGTDLVKNVPESKSAFLTEVEALIGLGRCTDALALADGRLWLLEGGTASV